MKKISTRKALSPAYRKHKPLRNEVNAFIEKLKECIEAVKLSDEKGESEEHIKSHFKDFFTNTFYKENYINTKERIDLAIYLDNTAKSDIGVIIEAKKPSNKAEFISENNLNKKALQELLLYYLRERLDSKNNNIKHLITTNGYEWFLFKAEDFYNLFFKNKKLIKEYESFRDGLKDTTKNELFYNEIAKKYIEEVKEELPFVYLDFSTVNLNSLDDNTLNTYYKIFSNVHLLGHSFGNDSNQLNKNFYHELLHIIGLEETTNGGKKVIQRKDIKNRDYASLLENTIFTLEDRDYLRNVKSVENTPEKPFNVGLELCLTWINRILFLKLLESQLATYHKGAKEYKFLNSSFIDGFDELNNLFFSALAKNIEERHPRYAEKFKYIPYLNSSLFERNELETETFEISALKDDEMEVYNSTVLKDANGKKFKGKLTTLDYLFKFLEAYDFATDGTEGIAEGQETKTLINASVLGLIFEKINGYKDGSFYTPAYITMYMCKETIRRAVSQKFKEYENDTIETFEDVKAYCHRFYKVEDTKRFNELINSLRICDPAVGSGHFLVSALNELISIKNDLGILVDEKGIPLRVDIQIDNDELYITDVNGNLFEYNPKDAESTRIQKTLFEEKQTLIENCLFGVDINPNSVKICRLRLWIELLKNAYYTDKKQLHTLPNIDINIKCGNSLISRFDLQDDLQDAFKGKDVKYNFTDYKKAVAAYKNSNSKEEKYQVLAIINEVKNNFKSSFDGKIRDKVSKVVGIYENEKQRLSNLEQFGEKIKKTEKNHLKKLKTDADKVLQEKEDILNNIIFKNAFEWRFEFPEVLADDGSYIGFDVVIGNPPYLLVFDNKIKDFLNSNFSEIKQNYDLFVTFIIQGNRIIRSKGQFSFITPNTFLKGSSFENLRNYIINNFQINEIIDFGNELVFEDANVFCSIINCSKSKQINDWFLKSSIYETKGKINFESTEFILISDLVKKLNNFKKLEDYFLVKDVGFNYWSEGRGKVRGDSIGSRVFYKGEKLNELDLSYIKGSNINKYSISFPDNFLRYDWKDYLNENDTFRFSEDLLKSKEKIVYRQTSNQIIASLDTNQNLCDKTVHIIINKENNISLRYLLSILNSKLINYYFKSYKEEEGRAFAQVKTVDIKNLPFVFEEKTAFSLDIKVNQILTLKKDNPEADTTALEKEIDAMVYELYGLSKEEIAIVENS